MSLPDHDNKKTSKDAIDLSFLNGTLRPATDSIIQETENLKSILSEFVDSFDAAQSAERPLGAGPSSNPSKPAEPFDVLLDRLEELNKYIDDILS